MICSVVVKHLNLLNVPTRQLVIRLAQKVNRPLAKETFALLREKGKDQRVKESSSLSPLPFNLSPDFCKKSNVLT